MTNKVLLARGESRGNLITPNFKQSYFVYWLPKVVENSVVIYPEKVRFEICAPSSNGEDVVKSYQMVDPAQVELLIFDLLKGYLKFKKEKGELGELQLGFIQSKLAKKVMELGKDIREGLYDDGIKG